MGESAWLDLLFILSEWPSQTVHFAAAKNSYYLRECDQKEARAIQEFGNPIPKTKKKKRLKEKPDAEMKNNYACRILGK